MVTTKPQEQESLRSASDFELTPSDAVEYPDMVHLGSDPLAEAKAALAPLLTKQEFPVFVFGPALRKEPAGRRPRCDTSSHANVMRHAEYLRHRTKAALEDEGFPAVFGEAPSMLKFWQSFLSSHNAAVSEILEAKKVCGAVVIFPASFGSLAELCLFARQGQIADKTLAVVEHMKRQRVFFDRGFWNSSSRSAAPRDL